MISHKPFLTNLLLSFALLVSLFLSGCTSGVRVEERTLSENWTIASTKEVNESVQQLSADNFSPANWVKAAVPTTVLGALVEAGIHKDPFFGKNLEAIPRAPFENPWWFRTTFEVDGFNYDQEQLRLLVDGINYRADFWLNGQQIASQDSLYGAFRQFELDISGVTKTGKNTLLVKVYPPQVRDFYMGFVDWAPTPPDHYMGIYREIRLKRTGKVSMTTPFVQSDLDPQKLTEATLTVSTELINHSDAARTVVVKGTLENSTLQKEVTLAPHQKTEVGFSPEEFEQLRINNPRLWWPNGLGNPELYTIQLELSEEGTLLDQHQTRFGIRKIETYLNDKGVRGYKVNGREVLIKSGGWVDDLFLRYMPEKDAAQIRYVKEMNLNSLRFEGFWGNNQHIYDLCDENGILLMVGWSCQWEWPDYLGLELNIKPGDENLPINEGVDLYAVKLTPSEETLLSDYFRDQVKWLRNHPSIFTWAGGSDAMPKPGLEKRYLETLRKYDPTRPFLVSAGDFKSEVTGSSGMKMNGPYEYVPPVYWYEDKKLGGAFGFNSETGPGPQVPPLESIRKMIPEADLWPPDNSQWNYHSGRKDFNSIGVYLTALNNKYGTPKNLEELALKAQLMNYEAIRPMFEAFVVNRPAATGVVQWMLNSPWPEFYWQLYDYYLMPTGAYYGTKKAGQPRNLIYDYHHHTIHVSNDTREPISNFRAEIQLLDQQSRVVMRKDTVLRVGENKVLELMQLPALTGAQQVYFLDLKLKDEAGNAVAENFYWLASRPDLLDWSKYFWYYTPQKQYADFTALNTLPRVPVQAEKKVVRHEDEYEVAVTLKNPSDKVAFFVELELAQGPDGSAVLPVFWSDNYVSLLPGESKTLTVRCSSKNTDQKGLAVRVKGYNLQKPLLL
ncbi:glycosyl hydrolase 2 galactose-binding domain-containing protein [Telluribacter sp.]|jgi:exo-1,4-beta-D-glucosaminidase|uniref:glycosyl hydrolase 2 galactose-binding domain-containing protein n=1 Tax=Telluribacter sp. TaxID=1978767 RepID=UPI002E14B708|nr:glycoside hydrolase family 2 protein [Telluribacter sp.]